MCNTGTKCRHLPKRVMRQYEGVLNILRPPTSVEPLYPSHIAHAFRVFMFHVIPLADLGAVARGLWRTRGVHMLVLQCLSSADELSN
jgi:hypothetical protein